MLETAKQERAAAEAASLLASKDAEIASFKAVVEICRRNVVLQRFLFRAIHSKLTSSFRTWRMNVAEIVRHENYEKKVSAFMRNRLSARAFRAWATVSLTGSDSESLGISDQNDLNEVRKASDVLSKKMFSFRESRSQKEFEIVTLADVSALRDKFTNENALPVWNEVKNHLRTALIFGVDHNMSVMVQNASGSSELVSTSWTTRPILFDSIGVEEAKDGADMVKVKAPLPHKDGLVVDSSHFHSVRVTAAHASSSSVLSLINHSAQKIDSRGEALSSKQVVVDIIPKDALSNQVVQVSEALSSQLQASRAALQKISAIGSGGSAINSGGEADVTINTDLVGKRFEAILSVANARISDLLSRKDYK